MHEGRRMDDATHALQRPLQGRLVAEGPVGELRGQLREQPHKVRLGSAQPRALCATLMPLPQVLGVEVGLRAVDVALSGEPGFYAALTRIGAESPGLVDEVRPLDDSLASVFGYLVG